jgi:hypothetical protein
LAVKDYRLNLKLSALNPTINTQGNFILFKGFSVRHNDVGQNVPLRKQNQAVQLLLDSTTTIFLNPGESYYGRFNSIQVVGPLLSPADPAFGSFFAFWADFACGFGERRDYKPPQNSNLLSLSISVPAADSVTLSSELPNFFPIDAVKEMRFCIPITEANGMGYASANVGIFPVDPVWLERGVIEWIDGGSDVEFFNAGAGAVIITVLLRLH